MKSQNLATGRLGETAATENLKQKGYEILERNFRNKFGEIDIFAKDKNTLVFVEVKTKIGDAFGLPEEMINKNKLSKIRRMATIYTKGYETLCRLDIIAIVINPKNKQITRLSHYQNVY